MPGERRKEEASVTGLSGARKRRRRPGRRGIGRTSSKKEAGNVPDGDIEEGRGGADQEDEDGTLASAVNRVMGLFLASHGSSEWSLPIIFLLGLRSGRAYITFLPGEEL